MLFFAAYLVMVGAFSFVYGWMCSRTTSQSVLAGLVPFGWVIGCSPLPVVISAPPDANVYLRCIAVIAVIFVSLVIGGVIAEWRAETRERMLHEPTIS